MIKVGDFLWIQFQQKIEYSEVEGVFSDRYSFHCIFKTFVRLADITQDVETKDFYINLAQ
jgi:hypothetical protein